MDLRAVARSIGRHCLRRRACYLVPGGFAVLVAILYAPVWNGTAGFGWDRVDSYWPDLAFLGRQFARGAFPIWNPYERGGYPAHADPQPGYFYPVHWLLAAIGAAIGKVTWWIAQVEEMLGDVLLASAMAAFLRSRRLPWAAALFGGAAAILSGTWMGDKTNNLMESMAWTPLIWLALDRLMEQPGFRPAMALAAALYMAASAGSPPGYFYTLLMAGTYGLFRLATAVVGRSRARIRSLVAFGAAAGGAILATQLILFVPGIALTQLSARAGQFRDLGYALDGLIGWQHSLIGLVTPTGGTAITYVGLIAVLSILVAITVGGRHDRGAALFFFVAGGFFLVLAFGSQTPVLKWFVLHVPGFDMFRVCARYRTPFGVCMAAAAGYGMAALLDPETRRGRLRVALLVAVIAGFVALVLFMLKTFPDLHPADMPPASRTVWLLAVTVVLAVAIAWTPGRAATLQAVLAIPLLFFDPHGFLHFLGYGFEPRPHDDPGLAEIRGLPGLDGYRVYDEFLLEPRSGSRLLLREFRGYQNYDPLATMAYREVSIVARTFPQILGEYNVRYVLHSPHYRMGWNATTFAGGAPSVVAPAHFRALSPSVFETLHPAPQVAWYGGALLFPASQVITAVAGVRDAGGTRRAAVLDQSLAHDPELGDRLKPFVAAIETHTAPPSVDGHVTRFDNERVSATIDAPGAGIVVLNEATFPGWQVRVDDRDAHGFESDGMLRAVLVPGGRHEIVWSYEPRHWGWLRSLWWLGLAMFVVAALGPERMLRWRHGPVRTGSR